MSDVWNVFSMVLPSTVFATICAGFFSLIISRRDNKLRYITEDRKKWRDEIKSIVDELNSAKNIHAIKAVLNKLKVRINPYGRNMEEDFMQDSHLWELIKEMEEKPYDNQSKNKEKLVLYLSLLLQYDRDKTQKEVKGNITNGAIVCLIIIGSLYTIYMHFIECEFEYNEVFLSTLVVFLFTPIILSTMHPVRYILNIFKRKKRFMLNILKFVWAVIISGVVVLDWWIMIRNIFLYYEITIHYLNSAQGYLEGSIVLLIMILLFVLIKTQDDNSIVKQYTDAVKEVYGDKEAEDSNSEKM